MFYLKGTKIILVPCCPLSPGHRGWPGDKKPPPYRGLCPGRVHSNIGRDKNDFGRDENSDTRL